MADDVAGPPDPGTLDPGTLDPGTVCPGTLDAATSAAAHRVSGLTRGGATTRLDLPETAAPLRTGPRP